MPIAGRPRRVDTRKRVPGDDDASDDDEYWTPLWKKSERERSDDPWRALRRASLRGPSKPPLHLHARALRFAHPESGQMLQIVADPPPHFTAALDAFRLDSRLVD